jgi:hypothetical protein
LKEIRGLGNLPTMHRSLPPARILAFVSGFLGLGAWAGTLVPLPTPFPEARYREMKSRSPFAVATATAVEAPAATPGFAAQLYVDGLAEAGGVDYVAIKSRDSAKPETLFVEVGRSTQDGIKVEKVQWSDEAGKSTVLVSKEGEKATLEFDEQTVKTSAIAAGPGEPPVPGPGPGFPPGMDKRRALMLKRMAAAAVP